MKRNSFIINGLTKKGILTISLLIGSLSLGATNPIKNALDNQQNQTERVSKESAETLKSASLQQVNQSVVPTVHNPKLDRMMRKFIESPEDKPYFDKIINEVYKFNGTFLGSALAQHEIDRQTFYAFMTKNTKVMKNNNINPELAKKIESFGPDFFRTVEPAEKPMTDWAFDTYTPQLKNALQFDHKPTAEEVLDRLDEIATKKSGFNRDEFIDYAVYADCFENSLKNKKSTLSLSDLIACKMFMIDRLVFKRVLIRAGVISGANFNTGEIDNPFYRYFEKWMESTQPTGN